MDLPPPRRSPWERIRQRRSSSRALPRKESPSPLRTQRRLLPRPRRRGNRQLLRSDSGRFRRYRAHPGTQHRLPPSLPQWAWKRLLLSPARRKRGHLPFPHRRRKTPDRASARLRVADRIPRRSQASSPPSAAIPPPPSGAPPMPASDTAAAACPTSLKPAPECAPPAAAPP